MHSEENISYYIIYTIIRCVSQTKLRTFTNKNEDIYKNTNSDANNENNTEYQTRIIREYNNDENDEKIK